MADSPAPLDVGLTFLEVSRGLDPKPKTSAEHADVEQIFTEVGRACARFELVQDELVVLFHQLCGGGPENTSNMALIIGATSSFTVKLDLARAAARAYVSDDDELKAVLGWLKLCGRAAEVRNKIAHGQPTLVHYVHEGQNRRGAFLMPSMLDARVFGRAAPRQPGPSLVDFRWTSVQIREFSDTFTSLRGCMMLMREQLAGALDPSRPDLLDPETQVRARG